MEEVNTVVTKKYEKDLDASRANWAAYMRSKDAHQAFLTKAERCEAYYLGDQWDAESKEKLAAQSRPALTINMVLGTVNAIQGEYDANRHNACFKPRENSDGDESQLLNKVYLAVMNATKYKWHEWQAFSDALITSRGYLDVRMGFDGNMRGDVQVRSIDPKDVMLDSQAREYCPSTWTHVIVTRWMSLDEIEVEYGKANRDKLVSFNGAGYTFGADAIDTKSTQTFGGSIDEHVYPDSETAGSEGEIKRVRIIERQHRKLARVEYFVDAATGDKKPVPAEWDEARVKQFADELGLVVNSEMERKIRWTVTADTCVLHDDWSPYRNFTIVPLFPYFQRGRPMGVVENLLSLQEQLNKVESQELHVINTTANSGYIMDVDALANMDEDELSRRGAETGLVLVRNPGKEIEKISPNQIPTGLDRVGMKITNNFTLVSGVNKSMLGQESAEVSGVALEHNRTVGLSQLAPLFKNLNRTRETIASIVLDLIQGFYSEERTLRIVHDDEREDEELVLNQVDAAGNVLNDVTVGKYDVVITTSPARDTSNETDFAEAIALQQAGVPIPPDKIVQYSNLPDKEDVARRIRVTLGVEPPTPEEQEMLEIEQQIAMKQKQLELAKLEAEVHELQTKAQLNMANAQDKLEGQNIRHEKDLEQKTAVAMSGDNLRRELAEKSRQGSLQQTVVTQEYKNEQLEKQAALKPEPTKKSEKKSES